MRKVSFIIVALNAEKVLYSSLGSLANQDYPHSLIEVILVDGMSSDNTKQCMLDFRNSEDSFSRVVVKDNPGKILACGWNVALKEVSGDIVLRVDAHTRFPKDFISKNVSRIEKGEDICGGKVLSILQEDTPWNQTLLAAENSMFGGGFTFFRRGEEAKYTNTLAFAAYRKEVFDAVGQYNEKLVRTEDNEMHYRMRKAGFKFFFDPDIVSYRYNRSSLKGLLRQKFLNGYWVGLTHAVEPKAFSVFYLVPALLVYAFLLLGIISTLSVWPIVLLISAYCFVLLLALIGAIGKRGWHISVITIPVIIVCLHYLYGIGTIKGLCEEDVLMKSSKLSSWYNHNSRVINKVLFWTVELILSPFKLCFWFLYLIFG